MNTFVIAGQDTMGLQARRLRIGQHLTQRALASLAGVPFGEVRLLERNMPVRLDTKRKLFKELWARKAQYLEK